MNWYPWDWSSHTFLILIWLECWSTGLRIGALARRR